MRSLLILASLAASVRASCGTLQPSRELVDLHRSFAQQSIIRRYDISVDVYVHIVAVPPIGYEFADFVNKQMAFINERFRPYGFSFNHRRNFWHTNSSWANGYDNEGMRKQTREGDDSTLNLWYTSRVYSPYYEYYGDLLGLCSLPTDLKYFPRNDGCILAARTTPGYESNVLGTTAIHEIGHWFGLYHPFNDNGCNDPDGDFVNDTPAQTKWEDWYCPEGRDSCPGQPGLDEVHNYMQYSYEYCQTNFTAGQVDRMRQFWDLRVRSNRAPTTAPTTALERLTRSGDWGIRPFRWILNWG